MQFDTSSFMARDLSPVVDAYIHAALGKYPRARYLIGVDAKYIAMPLQWLPEWLGDWILLNVLKKDSPKPKACKH